MGGHGASSGNKKGGSQNPTTRAMDAEQFGQLSNYMQQTHGITLDSSVANLDFQAVREGCQGIEDVLDEFPQVRGFVDTVDSSVTTAYAYGEYSFDMNGFSFDRFSMSRWAFGDKSRLEASLKSDGSFHPPNTDARAIMAHETAHAMEAFLANRSNGDPWSAFQSMKKHKEATRIVGEAAKAVKKMPEGKLPSGKAKTINSIVGEVSGYASKNRGEALAECVSDYIANGSKAHPLSREVWRILKKELG